jgi:hypothetical protein
MTSNILAIYTRYLGVWGHGGISLIMCDRDDWLLCHRAVRCGDGLEPRGLSPWTPVKFGSDGKMAVVAAAMSKMAAVANDVIP